MHRDPEGLEVHAFGWTGQENIMPPVAKRVIYLPYDPTEWNFSFRPTYTTTNKTLVTLDLFGAFAKYYINE